MANVVQHRKFSLTNLGNNNNKFWNVTLYDNDDVHSEWGRQGDGQKIGQQKTWHGVGRSFMARKIHEKEKKGYRENLTIGTEDNSPVATASLQSNKLKDIARQQIKSTSKLVQSLIDYLVRVNAHQIHTATGGKITYDTSTAQFTTTQGVIVPQQVARARILLSALSDKVADDDYDFEVDLNEYLSLIPRDFGRKRMSPIDILPDLATVQRENAILDSLAASFAGVTQAPKKKTKKKKADDIPAIFKVELEIIEDKETISWVRKLYQNTRKSMHRSNDLSVKTVYKVDIESMRKAFESHGAKLPDIRKLWHGTKASNLLSIMKGGLIIPPSSSGHCTGRMYGDGLYFSSISTKALNYATNYWGSGGDTSRTFMFLADVAMGKYHLAGGGWGSYPIRGTNSTWAKGGHSGVINDEMIVYKVSQANLVYLVEFCPRSRY